MASQLQRNRKALKAAQHQVNTACTSHQSLLCLVLFLFKLLHVLYKVYSIVYTRIHCSTLGGSKNGNLNTLGTGNKVPMILEGSWGLG